MGLLGLPEDDGNGPRVESCGAPLLIPERCFPRTNVFQGHHIWLCLWHFNLKNKVANSCSKAKRQEETRANTQRKHYAGMPGTGPSAEPCGTTFNLCAPSILERRGKRKDFKTKIKEGSGLKDKGVFPKTLHQNKRNLGRDTVPTAMLFIQLVGTRVI